MDVVLTGSVAFDYLMTFPGEFRDNILPDQLESISLSFLVESLVVRRGGTSPNIAYTMALLGERQRVMGTVGEDFSDYRHWLEEKGIDTSLCKVIPGLHTASFFATTDRINCQIASFYPGAMAKASDLSLKDKEVGKPDLVVISPNDPDAMGQYIDECIELGIPYLYDPGQQIARMEGGSICAGVENAWAIFVNEYELGLIEKKGGMTKNQILEKVSLLAVTRGEKGLTIYVGGQEINIPAFKARKVIDPTGGGDAFRGGFLSGMSRGWDWTLCGQMGALAATYCLEAEGPQGMDYTIDEFITRFQTVYDDGGKLDELKNN
ncbi:MAG: carbohydrate kinase family protein [Anaerolineales bacterium]|nr:carbohydrate kinase family protein [Anaerolineales bacterium]